MHSSDKSKNNCMKTDSRGFTLVELMVVVAIASMVTIAISYIYTMMNKTKTAQEQVVEMQQNIRAALDVMTQDIRMAGYDPSKTANAHIVTAINSRFQFTMDTNEDGLFIPDTVTDPAGESNENITYGFANANDVVALIAHIGPPLTVDDADQNGVADAGASSVGCAPGAASLMRITKYGTPPVADAQPIADNIQAIEFLYLDVTGAVTAVAANIRAVKVSILARSCNPDSNFTNTMTYTPASGVPWNLGSGAGVATNDHFRRRLMITTIYNRNLGL